MTIAVVQTSTAGNTASGTSITSAFGSNVAVGSLIVVYAMKQDGNLVGIQSTAITASGTAVLGSFSNDIVRATPFNPMCCAAVFSAIVTTAGSLTITFGQGSPSSRMAVVADELSGTWDATRFVTANSAYSFAGGTAVNSGSATSTGAAVFCGASNTVGPAVWGAINNGFTSVYSNGSATTDNVACGRKLVSAGESTSFDQSHTGASSWIAVVAVYKEGPSTPTVNTYLPPLPFDWVQSASKAPTPDAAIPITPAALDWFNKLRLFVNSLGGGSPDPPHASFITKDEGVVLSSIVNTLNFTGAGVTASGTGQETTIDIPGGGSGTITTKDEGTTLSTTVTTLDFVGAGVTASGAGATTTITIPGSGVGILQSTVFTASGTFTTGSGVTAVWVQMIGGGGGGSGATAAATGGGGGGSGEQVNGYLIPVSASTGYSVTIGTAGSGGAAGANGGDGTATSFGSLVSVAGGKGGLTTGTSGAGGGPKGALGVTKGNNNPGLVGSTESNVHYGGSSGGAGANATGNNGGDGGPAGQFTGGAKGVTASTQGGGGGGAASPWGTGGAGGNGGADGSAAPAGSYGAGGGAGGGKAGTTNGAAGLDGYCVVYWIG